MLIKQGPYFSKAEFVSRASPNITLNTISAEKNLTQVNLVIQSGLWRDKEIACRNGAGLCASKYTRELEVRLLTTDWKLSVQILDKDKKEDISTESVMDETSKGQEKT